MTAEKTAQRLYNWASVLEAPTREQAERTARMPFIYPHLALMPDAHLGRGATVGSVIPTLGAIMPAAVGVDIGCGMLAVRTQWTEAQVRAAGSLTALRESIETAVPLSTGKYNGWLTETAKARVDALEEQAEAVEFDPAEDAATWRLQLGTLGSGNHFIEVSADETGRVWLFLHSGSRGVGNRIATRHIKIARHLCEKWWIQLPEPDLAYLVEGTAQFWAYICQMRWAQRFAWYNREEMMDRVVLCIEGHMGEAAVQADIVNCHHNFTQEERHFGKRVWVSRKGAIHADAGRPGLIPGSMGTASYIVTGKGNALALNSSPHGAGRAYSRAAARRTFTHTDLRARMTGIEYRDTDAFIDEIPDAYKNIDTVMADAADLVEIKHTLRQIVNVKGD